MVWEWLSAVAGHAFPTQTFSRHRNHSYEAEMQHRTQITNVDGINDFNITTHIKASMSSWKMSHLTIHPPVPQEESSDSVHQQVPFDCDGAKSHRRPV